MEEKKELNNEELEKQELHEEALNQASGGGIVLRPSGSNQLKQSGGGNLL